MAYNNREVEKTSNELRSAVDDVSGILGDYVELKTHVENLDELIVELKDIIQDLQKENEQLTDKIAQLECDLIIQSNQ